MARADDTIEVIMRELVEKVEKLIPNVKHRKLIVLKNKDTSLHDEILNLSHYLDSSTNLTTRLKFISAGYTSLLKCKTCGNEHQHLNDRKEISEYCSGRCYLKDKNKDTSKFKFIDQTEKVRKMKETNKEKYGHEFNSQRKEIKIILSKSKLEKTNPDALNKLLNYEYMHNEYVTKNLTSTQIAENLNVYYGTVIDYLIKHNIEIQYYCNRSSHEKELSEFLNEYNVEVLTNVKGILNNSNLELDLYLPQYKFALEINGLYWHSSTIETDRHLIKTEQCRDKDISLFQFTDEQWISRKHICKSMILNKIQKSNRIFARQCLVKEISTEICKLFCEENHISGYSQSKLKYGLYYNGELIQIISLGSPRFDKQNEWELIRLCTKIGYNVVGGSSKLFKYIINNHNPNTVISYADRQYSEGNVYTNLGFTFSHYSKPGYRWTNGVISYNRMNFQKHKLKDQLKIYDENLSERENMFNNKYKMYWDSGQSVWIYKNPLVN